MFQGRTTVSNLRELSRAILTSFGRFFCKRIGAHRKKLRSSKVYGTRLLRVRSKGVFWLTVDGFFATSSSLERKFLGFQLFQMCLYTLNANLIPTIFSENCMRCMINHSLSGDRYLNKAAKKTVLSSVS